MRKLLCSLTILALIFATVQGFAASGKKIWVAPRTTSGKPVPKGSIKFYGYDSHKLAQYKTLNKLSYAMNQKLRNQGLGAKKNSYVNGTVDTIPYFSSWFITGSRNSVYPYSMVGHSPSAGGTTRVNTVIIPVTSVLTVGGAIMYTFDPNVATDPQGDDITLTAASPLFDATTTYPGPPSETGQFSDSHQRVAFRTTAAANWHTVLNNQGVPGFGTMFLEWNNGDWACISGNTPPCDPTTGDFPIFNINTISKAFQFFLTVSKPPNTTFTIFVTDWLTAFVPGGGCCVLGFHSAQAGIQDPAGVSVWTWGTFIPHNPDNGFSNPFAPFGDDTIILSHEIDETYNDPFVQVGGTRVSPWVDGSVRFAQANLETGDVIEGMAAADVVYNVNLPVGGGYTYTVQNVANLEWFTRNPFNGGIYSFPNQGTLSHAPHPVGCTLGPPCWNYGQGSAGFFFGPPF